MRLLLALAGASLALGVPRSAVGVTAAKKPSSKKKTAGKPKHKAAKKKAPPRERHVAATKGGLPNVQAQASIVIDVETGRQIFARNPDQERPIASISKLAAVLVVMDRGLELEGLTTIAHGDAEIAVGGARSRLLEGMTLSNRDLLHAALLGSDNRAVPALGRAVGMSPAQLAAAMTRKAKELALKHTRFREPTGLSPDNVSTPREVIAMLQAVMKHPVLGPIVRRVEYEAHPVARPPLKYVSTHKPAHRGGIEVLGGKTGYNNYARYCLVLAAKVDGHPYAMCFLATEGELTRFGDVARVTDWIAARKPKGASPATGTAAGTVLAGAGTTSGPGSTPSQGTATGAPEGAAPAPTTAAAQPPAAAAQPPAASAPAPAAPQPATGDGI